MEKNTNSIICSRNERFRNKANQMLCQTVNSSGVFEETEEIKEELLLENSIDFSIKDEPISQAHTTLVDVIENATNSNSCVGNSVADVEMKEQEKLAAQVQAETRDDLNKHIQMPDNEAANTTSENLQNIDEWLKLLEDSGMSTMCDYSQAHAMQIMAEESTHAEGIDFKGIYNFLANLMLELPQPHLDDISKLFLAKEVQKLFNVATEQDYVDQAMTLLRKPAVENSVCTNPVAKASLDPLGLDIPNFNRALNKLAKSYTKHE